MADTLGSVAREGDETRLIFEAIGRLTAAIEKQTQTAVDTAVYEQNMVDGRSEREGRASLARFLFTGSASLFVIFVGACYAAANGVHFAPIFAKGLCLVGALLSAMSMESGVDRWKYEMIALSNAIGFEKRGIGDGMATKLRDSYDRPTWMPGRVAAAGVFASSFWLISLFVLVYIF